jgi:SAM-dependent methyltransferase
MTAPRCPACSGQRLRPFHEQASVPVHSCLLLDDRDEALAFPRGRIVLALCLDCGFIANTAFDPSVHSYSTQYEESQACSPHFNEFARGLAGKWTQRYALHGRPILEIGCGKGDFLVHMVEAGAGPATGIDPSVIPERLTAEAARTITWIPEFFDERYLHLGEEAEAVICRHTLEHIADVRGFVRLVRRAMGEPGKVALFELPDSLRVLREAAFWDIYYEHCSYFTMGSLARLFRREGFEVLDTALEYDGQYILMEGRAVATGAESPAHPGEDSVEEIGAAVDEFIVHYEAKVRAMKQSLAQVRVHGRRAVIWGGGSKGVAYFNTLHVTDEIPFAVDINPRKHGKFMAGTGQEIVSPAFLREYRPDVVIAMNPIYLDEIRQDLQALGLEPELQAV